QHPERYQAGGLTGRTACQAGASHQPKHREGPGLTIPQTLLQRADHAIEYPVLDQRGQLLRAAVGFAGCSMSSYHLRSCLASCPGIGHVAVGMHRREFDLQLTEYDERGLRTRLYTNP